MAANTYTIVGLGELLWDLFPEGKQLGGAPANFAYMTNLLGDVGNVASRVGDDDLGREAKRCLEHLGVRTSFLQSDPAHPTGTVRVQADPTGQPTLRITERVPWACLGRAAAWRSLASI